MYYYAAGPRFGNENSRNTQTGVKLFDFGVWDAKKSIMSIVQNKVVVEEFRTAARSTGRSFLA